MSSIHQTMAFKNEVVSDEDIERYQLPFRKGGGRWWTRDVERDAYLWGGLTGNPAFDELQEGRFHFYFEGTDYWVKLLPEQSQKSRQDGTNAIRWAEVTRIEPGDLSEKERNQLLNTLKEALMIYGLDGQDDKWKKQTAIDFGF